MFSKPDQPVSYYEVGLHLQGPWNTFPLSQIARPPLPADVRHYRLTIPIPNPIPIPDRCSALRSLNALSALDARVVNKK